MKKIGYTNWISIKLFSAIIIFLILYASVKYANCERRTFAEDLLSLYENGKIKEARTKALEYSKSENSILQSMLNDADRSRMQIPYSLGRIILNATLVAQCEEDVFRTSKKDQDEVSRQVLDQVINIMETAATSVEEKNLTFDDLPREKKIMQGFRESRLSVIQLQLRIGGQQRADFLYVKHKKLFESMGIDKETFIKNSLNPQQEKQEAVENEVIKIAKKELPQIKETINSFYGAVAKMDKKAIMEFMPDEKAVEELLDGIKHEINVEKDIDKVVSATIDEETTIDIVDEKDGVITLRIKDLKMEAEKNDKRMIQRKTQIIKIAKKNGEWQICDIK